jgi:hypothetical protein
MNHTKGLSKTLINTYRELTNDYNSKIELTNNAKKSIAVILPQKNKIRISKRWIKESDEVIIRRQLVICSEVVACKTTRIVYL